MFLLPMLYLPPVSYMALLTLSEGVMIESCENYVKSSYRNRCEIAGANGVIPLSIPIVGGRDHHQLYTDTKISYTDDWQHRHWMSILSSYGSAPYFEHYGIYLKPFYSKEITNLYQWNRDLLNLMIKLMKLNVAVSYTDAFGKATTDDTDLRRAFKPSKPLTEITLGQKKRHLQEVPYIKVFGEVDAVGTQLSCLDLLMNTGPQSRDILRQMISID